MTGVQTCALPISIKDISTTSSPNPVLWGAGKINAYQAIKQAILFTEINENKLTKNLNLEIYPNPNNGNFIIEKTGLENDAISIEVRNTAGILVFTKHNVLFNNQDQIEIALPELSAGVYFTTVLKGNTSQTIKTVIIPTIQNK